MLSDSSRSPFAARHGAFRKIFFHKGGLFQFSFVYISVTGKAKKPCLSGTKKALAQKEEEHMKKTLSLILAILVIACTLPAGPALAEAPAENGALPLTGGWTPAADPDVTEELRALFDQAMEGLVGVNYLPVAYLGSQIVAGVNHAFLCQAVTVYPNAQPRWTIVYLYQDLSGQASILNIADFDIGSLCTYGAE